MNTSEKIFFTTSLLLLSVQVVVPQQLSIEAVTDRTWTSGQPGRVDIEITGAAGTGPCRLIQGYPAGFEIRPLELAGGNLFYENNNLNIVWGKFPPGRSVRISYEAIPDRQVSGEIAIEGYFYSVNRQNSRSMVMLPAMNVDVAGSSLVPVTSVDRNATGKLHGNDPSAEPASSSRPVYRVQVLTSSSRLTDEQLMKRLGFSFSDKVTVQAAANIYRYQVGECGDYRCAASMLEKFTRAGAEGAFIVAYLDGKQITIEQARTTER